MENLTEITKFATTLRGKDGIFLNREKMFLKFYDGIMKGKCDSDEAASKYLYNSKPGNKTYQKLKTRYRQRVLTSLLGFDLAGLMNTNYSKAAYQNFCQVFTGQILMMKGYEASSIELFKNSLQTSKKYDFIDLEIMALRKLRYKAAFKGDRQKFNEYNSDIQNQLDKYKAELLSEELSQKLILAFKKSALPKDQIPFAEEAFNKLSYLKVKYPSHTLFLNYYRVAIRHFHLNNMNKRAIKKCDEAMNYIRHNKPMYQNSRMGEFALHKMENLLLCRDYSEAKKSLDECLSFFIKGNSSWLVFNEIYFLLCLHTGKYVDAYNIYKQVIDDSIYRKMDHARKERWELNKLYLYLMKEELFEGADIRFSRFLNDIPVYSKDKEGFNLAILYLELILNIKLGKFDYLYSRYDAFRNYFYKYVKKDKDVRSYYFGKLLELLFRYEFDPFKSNDLAIKYLEKLKKENKKDYLQPLEIVPYEILWKKMISWLKEHRKDYLD